MTRVTVPHFSVTRVTCDSRYRFQRTIPRQWEETLVPCPLSYVLHTRKEENYRGQFGTQQDLSVALTSACLRDSRYSATPLNSKSELPCGQPHNRQIFTGNYNLNMAKDMITKDRIKIKEKI